MIALCVDDEELLLASLRRAVQSSPDITDLASFDNEDDALEWAETHDLDIAFLDVMLNRMDGIALAEALRRTHPGLPVIFCTGHAEFALDAFRIHADGFLMKPIEPADVQKEIDHVKGDAENAALLTVRCGAFFDVLDRSGLPLRFKRSKTLDVFSILVKRNGAVASPTELCELLWGTGDDNMMDKNRDYLHKLIRDLREALKAVGAEEVLIRTLRGYSLNMALIQLVQR